MARTCIIFTVLALLTGTGTAGAETSLNLRDFRADELAYAGFELGQNAQVKIEAVGLRFRRGDDLVAYAWILDADTRRPVWVMKERHTDRAEGNRSLRLAEEEIDLRAGRYELYFYPGTYYYGNNWNWRGNWNNIRNWIRGDDYDRYDFENLVEDDCYVTLTSNVDFNRFEPTGELPNTVFRFAGLGDGDFTRTGIKLDRDMTLNIYALVEYGDDWRHPADYGWIVDVKTGERVWQIDWTNTDHAGGADKNRVFDDAVSLDKGEYVLTFGTDDSHSLEAFNAPPPLDPLNWGVTITAASHAGSFQVTEVPSRGEAIIDLARLGDYDFESQGFKLKKDAAIRVVAIGEYSYSDREFVDYGWIENAETGEVVWEMTRRNTEHAGGAEKNRLFDGTIELPKGNYVAYAATDDSHSYRRWNSGAPFDERSWGLSIYAASGTSSSDVELVSEEQLLKNGNVLVRLVHIGDHERRSETFKLAEPTRVRVYALGEGVDGRMYDYGYIENKDTGDVVWEMTWRKTRHAGGARKNRMVNKEILLDAGTYEVHYETDDSHSFPDWNARRPHDPRSWGITISLANQ